VAALPVPTARPRRRGSCRSATPGTPRRPAPRVPDALDPLLCNPTRSPTSRSAAALGVRYLGLCCGAGPHTSVHGRGARRTPPASRTHRTWPGTRCSVTATAASAPHAMSSDSETGGSPLDVAIVGGGIIGLACAHAIHARGMHRSCWRARASAPAHRAATPAGRADPLDAARRARDAGYRPARGASAPRRAGDPPDPRDRVAALAVAVSPALPPGAFRADCSRSSSSTAVRSRSSTLTASRASSSRARHRHAVVAASARGSLVHDALRRAAGGWL